MIDIQSLKSKLTPKQIERLWVTRFRISKQRKIVGHIDCKIRCYLEKILIKKQMAPLIAEEARARKHEEMLQEQAIKKVAQICVKKLNAMGYKPVTKH